MALELYLIVYGFDTELIIKLIIKKIMISSTFASISDFNNLSTFISSLFISILLFVLLSIIIYTNLKPLYNYLVK